MPPASPSGLGSPGDSFPGRAAKGREAVLRLARSADVLSENFRPGAMERLGLGYEALKKLKPELIYCSHKGFLAGPYEQRTALDEVAQMMGGLAYMTGGRYGPLRAGASVNDVMGGMFGAIGILAALHQRKSTGLGQAVTSALFENNVFLVAQHMLEGVMTGRPAVPMPDRIRAWAVYDAFDTADGEKLFVGVVTDSQWKIFCEAFALHEFLSDPQLKTNPQRVEARARIIPVVAGVFRGLTRAEAIERCENLGLPFAPITRPEDLFDDPHLNASGGLVPLELPNGMKSKSPILPLEMDGRRLGVGHRLPRIGEHTREILLGLGYAEAEIGRLVAEGICRA